MQGLGWNGAQPVDGVIVIDNLTSQSRNDTQ